MPNYRYLAIDKRGRRAKGSLSAQNDVDLELRLKRMGLDLVTFKQNRENRFKARDIKRENIINLCFHLEQVTRAGIPLLEGLTDLREKADNPRFREVLTAVLEDMEGGKLLSQALAAHPSVFNRVFINLVAAGEQTGKLPEIFENLLATLKWQDELLAKTRQLFFYPIVVLVVTSMVIIFLLLYLVPPLVSLFKNIGSTLPLQTRILIGLSDFFIKYWPLIISLPLLGIAALAIAIKKNERAAYWFDEVKLRMPVIGPILQKIILARFASFFALMYRSGVSILESLKVNEEIAGNRVVAEGLNQAGQDISAGGSLSNSFQSLGLFPPLVTRMLKVGETTGALNEALLNINYFYTREIRESVERALKLLEIGMSVFLGLVLIFIMFSVLSPVWDLLGKLKI